MYHILISLIQLSIPKCFHCISYAMCEDCPYYKYLENKDFENIYDIIEFEKYYKPKGYYR